MKYRELVQACVLERIVMGGKVLRSTSLPQIIHEWQRAINFFHGNPYYTPADEWFLEAVDFLSRLTTDVTFEDRTLGLVSRLSYR
jgi:hypothetical protein